MSLPMLELVLAQQSEWLLATLSGATSCFTEHMECWQQIARALQGSGALQLIVQDDSLGVSGNPDGTTPAWPGGTTTPPAGFKVGSFEIDPFPDDKPLSKIDQSNYKDYGDMLGAGQQAMFGKYPSFRMDVYPTRRSASFPQRIYEFTAKNAANCKLVANGEGVENCAEGLPFPIPQNGYEVIWNHKLKYKGIAVQRWANQTSPTAGGAYNLVRLREELLGLYYKPGNTTENINNLLVYFFQVAAKAAVFLCVTHGSPPG